MTSLLPPPGVPTLIANIVSKPSTEMDGQSVRVVGRVVSYDAERNLATVAEPSKKSSSEKQVMLQVDTQLTDGLDCAVGSQVMLIGELEPISNDQWACQDVPRLVLKARVARCVDRLDYALYCKSLDCWR